MDLCRHGSVGANVICQERDSTSEANKFVALGIRATKKMQLNAPEAYEEKGGTSKASTFVALGIRPTKKMKLNAPKLITPESSTPVPTSTAPSPTEKNYITMKLALPLLLLR